METKSTINEFNEFPETAARIGFSGLSARPRPELRERLLTRIQQTAQVQEDGAGLQVWRQWGDTKPAPIHVVASNEGSWEELEVPGIRVKRLYVDPVADTVSLLIQMDAGTEWPTHRHAGPEHCYVISGELEVGDIKLKTGDYQVANTDSVHTVTRTKNGCTILIISSMHDELVK